MSRLESASHLAQVMGGIAMVVSVAYLSLQIADNNRLLRSQAHYNALDVAQRSFEALLENDTLAGDLTKCSMNAREVSDDTWARCSTYYFMQANGWEYLYYQNQDESIPPEFWAGADGYYSHETTTNPALVRFWEETALGFEEPFRSHIGARVMQNPAHPNTETDR